jgi:hypothetical protein
VKKRGVMVQLKSVRDSRRGKTRRRVGWQTHFIEVKTTKIWKQTSQLALKNQN